MPRVTAATKEICSTLHVETCMRPTFSAYLLAQGASLTRRPGECCEPRARKARACRDGRVSALSHAHLFHHPVLVSRAGSCGPLPENVRGNCGTPPRPTQRRR